MRSVAVVSLTLRTTAGTMSPSAMRRDQRSVLNGIDRLAFGDDVAARLAEAAALVDAAQAAIDGLVRGLLQLDVERRS